MEDKVSIAKNSEKHGSKQSASLSKIMIIGQNAIHLRLVVTGAIGAKANEERMDIALTRKSDIFWGI